MSRVTVLFVLATTLTVLTVVASGQASNATTVTVTAVNCTSSTSYCIDNANVTISLSGTLSTPPAVDTTLTLNKDYNLTCRVRAVTTDDKDNKLHSINCTLQTANVPDGEYKIAFANANDESIDAGYLRIGKFMEAAVPAWTNASTPLSPLYMVGAFSNFWPSTDEVWTVYGNFNTSATYKVTFYNTEDDIKGQSPGMPTCTPVNVTPQKLQCNISANASMMGMYRFLVQDKESQRLLPGSTVQRLIAVNPALPTVTSVTGDCATKSSACATGAVLSFTGSNFNVRAESYNVVLIGRTVDEQNTITCEVTNVTATTMACKLSIKTDVPPGAYPIHLRAQICMMNMQTPLAPAGYLVLHGKAEDKGWMTAEQSLSHFTVDSMAPSVLKDGDNLTITGTFDTTQKYQVAFSQDALPYSADDTFSASCNIISISATRIVCTYKSGEYTKDARYALVYDASHAYYLAMDRTKLDPIELHPALPVVQAAGGDCAKSSEACRNGATLTLSGTGFNPTSTAANRVTLVGLSDSSCDVVAVSTNSITCQLKIRSDDSGIYPIQVQTRIAADEWSAPIAAGSIVLNGGAGVAGWGTGAVPFTISGGKSTNNIAALACSVVFGVLFLIVAVALIVICCRYTFVRRGARNAQEPFWNATDTNHGNRHEMPSTSKGESQH